MSADPNAVSAEFGQVTTSGQITALEGNGGYLRVSLGAAQLEAGQTGVLQMHDGARFGVVVIEPTVQSEHEREYRLKLTGRA